MHACVTGMQLKSLLLRVLVGCLVVLTVAATHTPMQLKVFRGTLVHSRVRTEMEVLEDYLIGIDRNNYGTVSFFFFFFFLFCFFCGTGDGSLCARY